MHVWNIHFDILEGRMSNKQEVRKNACDERNYGENAWIDQKRIWRQDKVDDKQIMK